MNDKEKIAALEIKVQELEQKLSDRSMGQGVTDACTEFVVLSVIEVRDKQIQSLTEQLEKVNNELKVSHQLEKEAGDFIAMRGKHFEDLHKQLNLAHAQIAVLSKVGNDMFNHVSIMEEKGWHELGVESRWKVALTNSPAAAQDLVDELKELRSFKASCDPQF